MSVKRINRTAHVTKGSVFEDIGFSSEEAAVLRLKTTLHLELLKIIEKKQLSNRELEKVLDVPQPRVSELLSGKLSTMSVEKLAKYLHRLGREVTVVTKRVPKLQGSEVA